MITAGILICTTTITFLFFLFIASTTYISELDKTLDAETNSFIQQLKNIKLEDSGNLFDSYLINNNALIQLYTSDYKSVDIPTETTVFPDGSNLTFSNITASESAESTVESEPLFNSITQEYELHFADTSIDYILAVTGTRQNFAEIIHSVTTVFPIWLLIVLLISLLTAWFYSKFITKPIKELSQNSEAMANLNFDILCEINRVDEIGTLSKNLNKLSENLSHTLNELKESNALLLSDMEKERLTEQKRLDFFSSISHELKTPLTVLRGQLEGMIQGIGIYSDKEKYLRKALHTVSGTEAMVQEILTLSKISTANAIKLTNTNLSTLLTDLCYNLEDTAALNDIILHLELQVNVYVLTDNDLISKIFVNIIVNGINHSFEGSEVFISLKQTDNNIHFTCLNTNAYLPPESLPRIFDAFYRVDSSRNKETGGSGLGLYIVKTGLELLHANYSIENVENGVLFSILFERK